MAYPVDMNKRWYHGSPEIIEVLREGSTITQWRKLAMAFSKKPKILCYSKLFGKIFHTGMKKGFLYVIDEPLVMDEDIYQHPRTTMDIGVEFLTKRPLKVKRIL